MKTLCVAVVLLSMASVCRSASLSCEQLVKPKDINPDYSGKWYTIAVSSNICVLPGFLSAFSSSFALNINATGTPNFYDLTIMAQLTRRCHNISGAIYMNNSIYEIKSNNATMNKLFDLIQSGCDDCLIMSRGGPYSVLLLLSKRKVVTAAEMEEFKQQAECLGLVKPDLFGTDYEMCGPEMDIYSADVLKKMENVLIECMKKDSSDYLQEIYTMIKGMMSKYNS